MHTTTLKRITGYGVLLFLFQLLIPVNAYSQVGMTIAPNRLYYNFPQGSSGTQKIIIQNPHNKDIEIGVSIADWEYDSIGTNMTYEIGTLANSCADWLRIVPGTYFILKPYERKEIEVSLLAPSGVDTSVKVHTAMLYFTQLNPSNLSESGSQGANVKVTVKMGVKLYHNFVAAPVKDIDIEGFKYVKEENDSKLLELKINNLSETWIDGKVKVEVLNTVSGKKVKFDEVDFYQLPGDKRIVKLDIKDKVDKGIYNATAIVSYGDKDELKIADLDFEVGE